VLEGSVGYRWRCATSAIVIVLVSPSQLCMTTGMSCSQNSLMNCLHMPHGLQNSLMSVATAIALMSPYLTPCTIAVPRATRSAQVPTGYEAFSTLAPLMSLSFQAVVDAAEDLRRIVHPTRNCE